MLSFLFFIWIASAQSAEFDYSKCDDVEKVAEELIELELAGVRWQGGDSKCLVQSKFERVSAKKLVYGDAALLDPEVVLAKGKSVKIDPITQNSVTETWTVRFHYIGRKGKKWLNISDSIRFRVPSKTTVKTEGCALVLEEPVTFVMREECHHD